MQLKGKLIQNLDPLQSDLCWRKQTWNRQSKHSKDRFTNFFKNCEAWKKLPHFKENSEEIY